MLYKRIVIKLGTSTLTAGTNNISLPTLLDQTRQIVHLHDQDCQIILASSGAVAAGKEVLNFPELPKFIPSKQMLAAIGQPKIMTIFTQIFGMYNKPVAQVLLTREDIVDRRRYLNARNTLEALLKHKVIPIINENDTIATEEIRFGDNDMLSALIANLIEADLLILLTDQEGLYTGDPRRDSNVELIHQVDKPDIPEELWKAAGGSNSELGTGGMITKLYAADLARRSGTTVVIASGKEPDIILRVVNNEKTGSWFMPVASIHESKKRYLLSGVQNNNWKLIVDEGAAKALKTGASLLPVGIKKTHGEFQRGDTVRIVDQKNNEIAVGMVNYHTKDIETIMGHQSIDIESLLGYTYGDEVIHHNNMTLL